MPFFRFHSIDKVRLARVSRKMTDRIAEVVQCPREHIVLEVFQSDYIMDEEIQVGWPFIEVSWFERPLPVQDEIAKIVTECLLEAGYKNSDIYFQNLLHRNYYENGEHD